MREIFKGVSTEESKGITSPVFKIYIKELMPSVLFSKFKEEDIDIDSSVLENPDVLDKKKIKTKNYITSRSMTDYRTKYNNAEVTQMESSDVSTLTGDPEGAWMCPYTSSDHVNTHIHKITGPIKMYNFVIEKLNQETLVLGEEVILLKLSEHDYRVLHIPGKIPLSEE